MVGVDKQTQTDYEIARCEPGGKGPDSEGYHYVTCHDGASIRLKLLLGGPEGNDLFDPSKRTAICLHGVGDNMAYYKDGVFRTKKMSPSIKDRYTLGAGSGPALAAQDERRREKAVRALARSMNVIMVDLRGFSGSKRPRSSGHFRDTSISLVQTYEVGNFESFTATVRSDMETLRSNDAITGYGMSVLGSTAVLRVCWGGNLAGIGTWMKGPFGQTSNLDEAVATHSNSMFSCSEEDTKQFEALGMRPWVKRGASRTVDREGRAPCSGEDVTVIHKLRVHGSTNTFQESADMCIMEASEDELCLSFYISLGAGEALVHGSFAGAQATSRHLLRFRCWMSGNTGEASASGVTSLGSNCEEVWTQVHARNAELRKLWSTPQAIEGADVFQIFPLSFELAHATMATATVDDFTQDIESILRYIGTPSATIVGHSMGAAVALQHAVDYPSSVERLVLMAPSHKVGKAAYDNWQRLFGSHCDWNSNVMRDTVSVVNIDDEAIEKIDAPTLMINAKDDSLTPIIGAELLLRLFPRALLDVPEVGDHNVCVWFDSPFERIVQFMMANEALVFAENPLSLEIATSRWNLGQDDAFMKYYMLGNALGETECAERRLRLVWNWARDAEFRDQQLLSSPYQAGATRWQVEHTREEVHTRRNERAARIESESQAIVNIFTKVGLAAELYERTIAPRDLLLEKMTEHLALVSAPARLAVEEAGVWWRDTGKAERAFQSDMYTVDFFGRRRGASKKLSCAWYRWDMSCVPEARREGFDKTLPSMLGADAASDMIRCWWCGGPPGEHEDLGDMGDDEVPGDTPGKKKKGKTTQAKGKGDVEDKDADGGPGEAEEAVDDAERLQLVLKTGGPAFDHYSGGAAPAKLHPTQRSEGGLEEQQPSLLHQAVGAMVRNGGKPRDVAC